MQAQSQGLTSGGACLLQPTRSSVRRADRLLAWIDSYEGGYDTSTMRVTDVLVPCGPKPGYASIEIRRSASSRKANSVAFRFPWEAIQIGQRVVIARATSSGTMRSFWVGSVAAVASDIKKDVVTVTAYDDRWLLQDIRIVGRHVVEPSTGELKWQQGWPAAFNAGGRPDMLLSKTKSGGVAVPGFAPYPDYGLDPDEAPPASPTGLADQNDPKSGAAGEKKACYWTLSWIFRYLHYAYGPYSIKDDRGQDTEDKRYEGLRPPKTCPGEITWTPGMAGWVDSEDAAWFDNGRGQGKAQASGANRKGRSISADGYALLEFMEMLLATAGGYTIGWYMTAQQGGGGKPSGNSIFNVTRSVPRGGQGGTIHVLRGGDAEGLSPPSRYFTGGTYREDGTDLVTRAMGLGSLAKVERQMDTYVTTAIVPRWSTDEKAALLARGNALNVGSVEGMRALFSEFPNMFSAWKVREDYDFSAGTSEAEKPRAQIPRPIMPYLLSWIGTVAYDYVAQRYPIRVEISQDDGQTWATAPELTGLEVLDDGTILIPALRELTLAGMPGSWRWTGAPFSWGAGAIAQNEIRMTLAIPFDHRLDAVCKLVGAQLSDFDDTHVSADANRISRTLDRQEVLDLRGLYDLWLRKDSWPVPQSQQATSSAPDMPTRENALRNDHELLKAHVRRRMIFAGRLKRSGYFSKRGCIDTSILELGKEFSALTSITESGNVTVPISCVRTAVQYRVGRGYLETLMHVG